MENNKLKKQVISGLFWKFGERLTSQGVSFIISIVLARLLMPEEYGTVALILIFINLANVFVSDGLGAALIQKKDANEEDFSTMFFCSLAMGVVLYIILFFSAPWISVFYNKPELTFIIRVLSLQIPLSSVQTIQQSYVSKHMMFKKFFFSTLIGTIVSGVIGIIMAYNGFGVWALVQQYLVNRLINMIVLFAIVPWRPRRMFNNTSAKSMFSYSWKLLAASLINTLYGDLRSIVIGKVYSSADLAYNNKGNHFPSLLITNINSSLTAVLFPAMSKVNGDIIQLKALTRKSMKLTSYVIFPLMIGMLVVAEPFVRLILTDNWIKCVPFLQVYCIYYMFQPCLTANNQALKAAGRSDMCLKLEVVKKIIGVSMVLSTMFISVEALAFSNVIFAFLSTIVNIFPNRKIIKYGYKEQLADLLPSLLIAVLMGAFVWSISLLHMSSLITLLVQVLVGAVTYVAFSVIFKVESFNYIIQTIKGYIKK